MSSEDVDLEVASLHGLVRAGGAQEGLVAGVRHVVPPEAVAVGVPPLALGAPVRPVLGEALREVETLEGQHRAVGGARAKGTH